MTGLKRRAWLHNAVDEIIKVRVIICGRRESDTLKLISLVQKLRW